MAHLTDTEENEPYTCDDCKHCTGRMKCKAYPEGIPLDTLLNPETHASVADGQQGNYVFTPAHEPLKRNVYGLE